MSTDSPSAPPPPTEPPRRRRRSQRRNRLEEWLNWFYYIGSLPGMWLEDLKISIDRRLKRSDAAATARAAQGMVAHAVSSTVDGVSKKSNRLVRSYLPVGNLWYLLQGVPALLMALVCLYLFTVLAIRENSQILTMYRTAAHQAAMSEDWAACQLYYDRLEAMGDSNIASKPENYFFAAIAYYNQGDIGKALYLMDRLTSPKINFARAHLWLGSQIRNNMILSQSEGTLETAQLAEMLRRVIFHYTSALPKEGSPESPISVRTRTELGSLYLRLRDMRSAVRHLERAVSANLPPEAIIGDPDLSLALVRANRLLAEIDVSQGKRDQGIQRLRTVRDRLENEFLRDPKNFNVRVELAQLRRILGDVDGAEILLVEALQKTDPSQTEAVELMKRELAMVKLTMAARLSRQQGNAVQQIKLLQQALDLDPENPEVVQRVTVFAADTGRLEGEEGETYRAALRELLARGRHTALIHVILSQAYFSTDLDKSQYHVEEALRAEPPRAIEAVAANNLAWILLTTGRGSPDRCLELVNRSLAVAPRNPLYRDTRGRIYVQQGDYREALDDFRVALEAMPNYPELHLQIAETYDKLGQPELADVHRKRNTILIEAMQKAKEERARIAAARGDGANQSQPSDAGNGFPSPSSAKPDAEPPKADHSATKNPEPEFSEPEEADNSILERLGPAP